MPARTIWIGVHCSMRELPYSPFVAETRAGWNRDSRTKEMKPGVLALDPAKTRVAFGQPSRSPDRLKRDEIAYNRVFRASAHHDDLLGSIKEIGVARVGRLLRRDRYAVRVRCHDRPEYSHLFWGAEGDVRSFVRECEEFRTRFISYHTTLDDAVLTACKTQGRVHLETLASRLLPQLRKYISAASLETVGSDVRESVTRAIMDDAVNGFIDADGERYVDRRLAVKRARVSSNLALDFDALARHLSKSGLTLSSVRCPRCTGSCAVPGSGTSFHCEHCGRTTGVVDVVEVLKGVL